MAYFSLAEFKCRCCGSADMSGRFLEALEVLRQLVGEPIYVSSGFRCRKHNRAVGGKANSYHLLGRAADIHCKGKTTAELHAIVVKSGLFGGVGFYPTKRFVHVDNRMKPVRWTE